VGGTQPATFDDTFEATVVNHQMAEQVTHRHLEFAWFISAGATPTPLKNMSSSVGNSLPNINGKSKNSMVAKHQSVKLLCTLQLPQEHNVRQRTSTIVAATNGSLWICRDPLRGHEKQQQRPRREDMDPR